LSLTPLTDATGFEAEPTVPAAAPPATATYACMPPSRWLLVDRLNARSKIGYVAGV
jgi:hypothetical protein